MHWADIAGLVVLVILCWCTGDTGGGTGVGGTGDTGVGGTGDTVVGGTGDTGVGDTGAE